MQLQQPKEQVARLTRSSLTAADASLARITIYHSMKAIRKMRSGSPDWQGNGCAWRYVCYPPGGRPEL